MKDIQLRFKKMHGAGNNYIYMDSFSVEGIGQITDKGYSELARKVSDRNFGIGSDGLILILPSDIADFKMRIFNADGSEAQMCGNGIRCVGKYVYESGLTKNTELDIETLAGIRTLYLHVKGGEVKEVTVDMGAPSLKRKDIPVKGNPESEMISEKLIVDGDEYEITGVSMGNPHGVVFVKNIKKFDVSGIGSKIECNEIFPEKANIEFIQVVDSNHLKMRVWERGSGETFACGTGACAAVVAAHKLGFTDEEVTVSLLGGDLKIKIDNKSGRLFMTGEAETIAEGKFFYIN